MSSTGGSSGPAPRRRRWRLGPSDSITGWSPSVSSSSRGADDPDLEEWIDVIRRALEENGELGRKELGDLVGCRYWGPGAYSRALREGASQGAFRRTRRNRYAPA